MTLRLLDQKIQKLVAMESDSPEVLESLESLSTFYRPSDNAPDSRVNLREVLEGESLHSIEDFLSAFGGVAETFRTLEASVGSLKQNCEELQTKINATQEQTSSFLNDISELRTKQVSLEQQEQEVMFFLKEYQLTSSEIAALERTSDVGANKEFYEALQRVIDIRARAQHLLGTDQQSAGLEVMEEMSEYQEAGLSRLYKWFQRECERFGNEELNADTGEDPKETLGWFHKALSFLKKRPLLYRHSQDFVAESRGARLTRRFLATVTVGDPSLGVRPIDLNSHDPVRYVGDILAWVHQSTLMEIDTIIGMFGKVESEDAPSPSSEPATAPMRGETSDNKEETKAEAGTGSDGSLSTEALIDKVFAGVIKPIETRMRQLLGADLRIPLLFKIHDMIMFYQGTFEGMALVAPCLAQTIKSSKEYAWQRLESQCEVLTKRANETSLTFTADLSPPPLAKDLVVVTEDLVRMTEASLSTPKEVARYLDQLLPKCWGPMFEGCRKATEGLAPADSAVFVINVMNDALRAVEPLQQPCTWKEDTAAELESWKALLSQELAQSVLINTGMAQRVRAVASHDGLTPLSQVPGMETAALKDTAKAFYASVFNATFSSLSRLINHVQREEIRRAAAEQLVAAYETIYAALYDPANAFEEPATVFPHAPLHVRTMLDIDEEEEYD